MTDRPLPFPNYVLVSTQDIWQQILDGHVAPHVYSTKAKGDLAPVPISAAQFSWADQTGRDDPALRAFQIMWIDRDTGRPVSVRHRIPVPHWVYVMKAQAPAATTNERRAGAKAKYDWHAIKEFTFEQLTSRGDFAEHDQLDGWRSAADLYRAIEDKFGQKSPELTTLKEKVPAFVAEWRSKVGN
ncbi:hypothetical protein I3J27_18420 [Bradyrhizobium xenonodulans]|uniref:Uncharacterized protein n=1 Tax=Bradyrhizobium xenonodulans TaxID=2736875 RepID=A0ABY7MXQ8_9BRAD|nr:hypothetical protein [Bradyrhizobium xenonodulans]WBL82308.1 hypothetical protein I3J27_18420 [Bradyrhizobium xenonodulans]